MIVNKKCLHRFWGAPSPTSPPFGRLHLADTAALSGGSLLVPGVALRLPNLTAKLAQEVTFFGVA